MPFKLFYSYTFTSFTWVIITCLADIIINLFLIKASKNQPEGVVKTQFLSYAAVTNVFFILMIPFIPLMNMYDYSLTEYQLYKFYSFSQSLVLPTSALITSGMFFFIFGRVNRKHFDTYLLVSGMLMILSTLFNIISLIIYYIFMFDPIFINPDFNFQGSPVWGVRVILTNFEMTTYALSIILFFMHAKINKDRYIMRSIFMMIIRWSVLYMVFYSLVNIFGP